MTTHEILIIDDEAEIAEILADFLTGPFEPTVCTQPSEAMGIIKDKKFAAILTDLNMPKVNGLDVVRFVTSLYNDVPVIVLTGAAAHEPEVRAALAAGAKGIIGKPFGSPKQLCEKLAHIIEGKS